MDGSRDPGSGLFNRSELPQSYGTERAPLAPIAGGGAPADAPPRARAGSVPRLAVAAKASTGSGLIDLDEVARSLEKQASDSDNAGQASAAVASPPLASSAEALTAAPTTTIAGDSEPLPVDGRHRGLLMASIGLLVVVAGLLGYLATV